MKYSELSNWSLIWMPGLAVAPRATSHTSMHTSRVGRYLPGDTIIVLVDR